MDSKPTKAQGVSAKIVSVPCRGVWSGSKPGENSPWALDLNLTGYAGTKRGLSGGVSVAWMF